MRNVQIDKAIVPAQLIKISWMFSYMEQMHFLELGQEYIIFFLERVLFRKQTGSHKSCPSCEKDRKST